MSTAITNYSLSVYKYQYMNMAVDKRIVDSLLNSENVKFSVSEKF
jgi:hypothetical protein